MSKYYFLHPKSLKVCDIYQGRSLWEDHGNKAEFVVVKTVGPAMEHYEEAMREDVADASVLDEIQTGLSSKGYPQHKIDAIIRKLQE